MTYRIVITLVFVLLAVAAIVLAPGESLDKATQSVQQPPAQVTTPAQKSEDDALKGFKLN